jgi:RNA polymerase sigma factor (sigma-70 family)
VSINQTDSDEALMQAFSQGNGMAFDWVYERNRSWLLHMLCGKLRSLSNGVTLAEDVAQDTWLAIIKTSANYQPTAKFSTWLYTLANQRLIDQCRKIKPDEQLPWESAQNETQESDLGALSDQGFSRYSSHGAYQDDVLDSIERKQLGDRLLQAIDDLPGDQQEVFILVAHNGMSVPEAAQCLGWPVEATKSRLRYARAKLVQALGGLTHE